MNCQNCDQPTAGKSKYCATHRAEARTAFKAMIAEKESERAERNAQHQKLLDLSAAAAEKAYIACEPAAMVVYEASIFSDAPKPGGKSWYAADGVCGFAWIVVKPATSSFGRWLSSNNIGYKAYTGGWVIPTHALVGQIGQSLERAEAAVRAAAQVLRDNNINCYVESRMD